MESLSINILLFDHGIDYINIKVILYIFILF